MFVALVKNDRIKLLGKDGELKVSSYTGLKSEPSVYLKEPLEDGSLSAPFSEIVQVNGVKVVYDDDSKLLKALGPLKRAVNLPQPGDKVTYTLVETDYEEEQVTADVTDLRLHARGNHKRSLQVKVESGTMLELTSIINIDRKVGNEPFDRSEFQRYYVDYLGFGGDEDKSPKTA